MNKTMKNISTVLLAICMVCMFAVTAFASEYYSTGDFRVSMTSANRYFDGNSIGIKVDSSVNMNIAAVTSYKMVLQRKNWIGYTDVGYVNVPKTGHYEASFTNVGSGTYRFYYSKANDGASQYVDLYVYSY